MMSRALPGKERAKNISGKEDVHSAGSEGLWPGREHGAQSTRKKSVREAGSVLRTAAGFREANDTCAHQKYHRYGTQTSLEVVKTRRRLGESHGGCFHVQRREDGVQTRIRAVELERSQGI